MVEMICEKDEFSAGSERESELWNMREEMQPRK